jgi:hypothetical protein
LRRNFQKFQIYQRKILKMMINVCTKKIGEIYHYIF